MYSSKPTLPSDAQIAKILVPYYSAPTTVPFCDRVRAYIALLLHWNQRISLTTVTDPLQILRFHFGESLFAIDQVPIRHGRLADVGSGAGFPAVPIRMALEGLRVTLIESNRKKATFLSEVSRELGLENLDVRASRMEDLADSLSDFDFVSARAVAIDDASLLRAEAALKPGGSIVLWLGQQAASDLSLSKRFHWRSEVKIPGSERRLILVGTRVIDRQ